MQKYSFILILNSLIILASVSIASASIDQLKIYRKAYSKAKPNCMICHTSKVPKKGDGMHDLNAYGSKALEMAGENEITQEIYESLGNADDFNADEAAQAGDAAEEITEKTKEKIMDSNKD